MFTGIIFGHGASISLAISNLFINAIMMFSSILTGTVLKNAYIYNSCNKIILYRWLIIIGKFISIKCKFVWWYIRINNRRELKYLKSILYDICNVIDTGRYRIV